jgi:F-type H+-transporting ATPase subunit b
VQPILLASAGPMQTFVVQLLGFVVVVVVLVKFVFPALQKILGGRTQGIEETFRKIDQDNEETARQLRDIKEKLAQAGQESQRRLQATLDDANRTRTQLLAESATQVAAALDKAKREIQIERDKAVLELRQEATSLTLRAAEALVASTMNDPIHEKIVNKYLSQLEAVKTP